MTPELPEPNYYDKFLGAALGSGIGDRILAHSSVDPIYDLNILGITTEGLINSYRAFTRPEVIKPETNDEFGEEYRVNVEQLEAGTLVGAAARLLCRDEIMLEDLISAVIDYLPPGSVFDNPFREKMLAAQDYLEERQTLVNNIISNDLNIDMVEIDKRNVARSEAGDTLPGKIAAAFYIVTAQKESFEKAIDLTTFATNKGLISAIVGFLSGIQHGSSAIPKKYYQYDEELIAYRFWETTAKEWHQEAQNRVIRERITNGRQ